jgi:L-ribulokinase
MAAGIAATYVPDPASRAAYDTLYAEYTRLHDRFGRGADDVMKALKHLRDQAVHTSAGLAPA